MLTLFALTAGQKRRGRVRGRSLGCAGHARRCADMFRKLAAVAWGPEFEEAFQRLKSGFFNSTVLAHPDFPRPFILSVDVSLGGLGAVLAQGPTGEDKAWPLAFASKILSKSQQRYPAYLLKFMALKWSVTYRPSPSLMPMSRGGSHGLQHVQLVQQTTTETTGSCSSSEVRAALIHLSD